jgi:hypothetical protein
MLLSLPEEKWLNILQIQIPTQEELKSNVP